MYKRQAESGDCSLNETSAADHSTQHSATASTASLASTLNFGAHHSGRQSMDSNATSRMQAMPCSSASTAVSGGHPTVQHHAKRKIAAVCDSISSFDEQAGVPAAEHAPADTVDDPFLDPTDGEGGASDGGDALECGRVLLAPVEKDEARRRWGLLRTHVAVLRQETRLRRSMWVLAVDAMKHPLAPAASSSQTLFSSFFLGEDRTDDRTDSGSDFKRPAADTEASATPRESGLKTCVTASIPGDKPVGGYSAGMKEVLSQLEHRKVERAGSISEKVYRQEDSPPAFHACGKRPASSCPGPLVEELVTQRVAALSARGAC